MIGYCPQFDALIDLMTGRELLYMIARVRGVPEDVISRVVDVMIQKMQLENWADQTTRQYR